MYLFSNNFVYFISTGVSILFVSIHFLLNYRWVILPDVANTQTRQVPYTFSTSSTHGTCEYQFLPNLKTFVSPQLASPFRADQKKN